MSWFGPLSSKFQHMCISSSFLYFATYMVLLQETSVCFQAVHGPNSAFVSTRNSPFDPLVHWPISTLIIPISACGTNSWNAYYSAKSQNEWGLNFLTSDVKVMNTCAFAHSFQEYQCVLRCLYNDYFFNVQMHVSVNNAMMNSANTFSEQCCYE